MNRRIFLRNTTPIALGVPLLGTLAFKEFNFENKESLFFKLSLAQWSLHKLFIDKPDGTPKKMSPYEFASLARKHGFEGLEYVGQLYRDVIESDNQSKAMDNFIKESNKRADDNGLKNLIIMVDNEGELASSSAEARAEGVNKHKKWVDAAAAMKCHSVRVNLFGEKDPTVWKESAKEGLAALADYAATNNINVLVENHGWNSSQAQWLMEVINHINKENCGVLPDFGNFCVRRDGKGVWDGKCIDEYDKYKGVEELMPKAFAVSAKSYGFDENGNETTIDYERMLKIVKDSGYKGYIGVEYEGQDLSPEEGVVATKELLIKIGKKLNTI